MRKFAAFFSLFLSAMMPPAILTAQESSGSGFFVNHMGWVLTNAHVVEGCDTLEIANYGTARPIFVDKDNDLAVVLIPGQTNTPFLSLRQDNPRLAEAVVALGYPLSNLLSESIRVTTGSVSSFTGIGGDERLLQISAPIQPGNSGGPVLDSSGLVVGIATSTLSESAYDRAQNVNFAVDIGVAIDFLQRHGIEFTRAPSNPTNTDITIAVENATQSVLFLKCSRSGRSAGAPSRRPKMEKPQISNTRSFTPLEGLDVLGFDFQTIRQVSLRGCQSACKANQRCVSYTFNRRHNICFLKDDAAIAIRNADATGGVLTRVAGNVLTSSFVIQANVDAVGGDYRKIVRADFIGCFIDCTKDRRCRAFAYVRESQTCWLKDRVGVITPQPGIEFGLK